MITTNILIFNILIPMYKYLTPPDVVKNFTKEMALEDYDFLWETLEARYPYIGVAERKLGIDVEAVKNTYRKKIEDKRQIDIKSFFQIVNDAVSEMGYIGHLAVFDSYMFFRFKDVLDLDDAELEKINLTYQIQALKNENALQSYGYMKNEFPIYMLQKLFMRNSGSNIKTSTPVEKVAFLEILYPSTKNQQRDFQYLMDYYNKLESEGYKHLIIHIHANDSGDPYWMYNIVAPNINEVKTLHTKAFVNKDPWVKDYYENLGVEVIEPIEVESYSNLNLEDAQKFGGYIEGEISIEPLSDKKAFSGAIYLLTDSRTYSTTEAFAQFAKGTGFATVVGHQTGGDGYNGGTPMMTNLPNSGFIFFYRLGYGINEDGASNVEHGTTPDVIADQSEAPLAACLRLINEISAKNKVD